LPSCEVGEADLAGMKKAIEVFQVKRRNALGFLELAEYLLVDFSEGGQFFDLLAPLESELSQNRAEA